MTTYGLTPEIFLEFLKNRRQNPMKLAQSLGIQTQHMAWWMYGKGHLAPLSDEHMGKLEYWCFVEEH